MKNRIKIWFHSGATSAIREFTLHKGVIFILLLLMTGALSALGYMGYDYFRLKQVSFNTAELTSQLSDQTSEIHNQRVQIQQFAREIESLKVQVKDLYEFEDKIRLIADIKKTSDASGLIGIGGIPTSELDEDVPREMKHNSLIREMHKQVGQVNLVVEKQSQDFEDLIKVLEEKKNLLASTPSIRPVSGYITSAFGYRVSPFTGKKEFHSGLDISNKTGTEIVATAQGKVTYAGRKVLIGNLVTIDHGFGRETKYGHMDKIHVKKGQKVKRGDVIGTVGKSGRTTGPHLHYEVRINGAPENPLKYILN